MTRIDAVVPGVPLTLGLCAGARPARPVRARQPDVTLLAPACALGDLAAVGEGKHLRFRVGRGGLDGGSRDWLRHGRAARPVPATGRYDVAFRLQENRWNGTVAPQLVVQRLFDTPDRYREVRAWFADEWQASGRERRRGRGVFTSSSSRAAPAVACSSPSGSASFSWTSRFRVRPRFRTAHFVAGTPCAAANGTAHAFLETAKDAAAEQPGRVADRARPARRRPAREPAPHDGSLLAPSVRRKGG